MIVLGTYITYTSPQLRSGCGIPKDDRNTGKIIDHIINIRIIHDFMAAEFIYIYIYIYVCVCVSGFVCVCLCVCMFTLLRGP